MSVPHTLSEIAKRISAENLTNYFTSVHKVKEMISFQQKGFLRVVKSFYLELYILSLA